MITLVKLPPRPKLQSIPDVIQRYPRLTAHLVCHSLGYFTPESAANAIRQHLQSQPSYCEWYYHMCGLSPRWKRLGRHPTQSEWDTEMLAIGKREIASAFRYRHTHRGYMAEYRVARALVDHVRAGGQGPVFASWF